LTKIELKLDEGSAPAPAGGDGCVEFRVWQ